MLYFFWGLLNIGLLLYFISISIKIFLITKKQIGGIATIVFALGLLSFMSSPNEEKKPKEMGYRQWRFVAENKLEKGQFYTYKSQDIEKEWFTRLSFDIEYAREGNHVTPISGHIQPLGFISGIKWKTQHIDLKKQDFNDNKYDYTIHGVIAWKLFSFNVYTQLKTLKGSVVLQ
jgi:hypothetical protein